MGRAPCCDKANVKKGPWSPEEDAKLKSYIEKHGTGGNWIALPQKIGLRRCGKSCRLRWLNYLRPNIKHGGFTEDEDNLICSLYISIGSRWSIIAAQLPGRTDNDIKNYWNTRLKKKLLGKQRREQLARRETKKLGGENFLNSEFFSLCPQPPQLVAAPPLLVGHGIQETRVRDNQISNNCLNMGQIEGIFFHDHEDPSLNNKKLENHENYNYISDISCTQNQPLCKNSMVRLSPSTTCNYSFVNSSCLHPLMASDLITINGVATNHSQEFDKIPLPVEIQEIMHSVPQDLVGLDSLSTVEMVNNTSSWGDVMNSLVYPSNNLSNSEIFQQKSQQDWTFLDDLRFLGYIQ